MRALFPSPTGQSGLGRLLAWTLGSCVLIFGLLEFWRPCYFLTDDNLSGFFPVYTQMGKDMLDGQSPLTSKYIFGGGYDYLRDIAALQWHPFVLFSCLLAGTDARFWIIDACAFLYLILAASGFTVLAYTLREELSLKIPDAYVVFYTLSFVFSSYILTVGSSWINFLGNQSALPWLALGILNQKVFRGTMLVMLFSVHQLLCGYAGSTVASDLCLTLFAMGVARWRHSIQPLFGWVAGNFIAVLVVFPLLLQAIDGFGHSVRNMGLNAGELLLYYIPAFTFPFSFFVGNWSEPLALLHGDKDFVTVSFPYLSSMLACAAAWCIVPVLLARARWRPLEKVCLVIIALLILAIVRPVVLEVVMMQIPLLRSMRWPFRECMQFLFFVHLLLVIRFPERLPRWQPALAIFSTLVFLLPLPFVRVPTLNALFLDRQLLFSGQAERFWAGVKTQLKPSDQIATVINFNFWNANRRDIPYTLLGTANFPEFFQVPCVSGYSTTAPIDQLPLKMLPGLWFGAYREDELWKIVRLKPNLKLMRIKSTHPLTITMSTGYGPEIDLSGYLQPPDIKAPAAEANSSAAH